MPEHVNPEEQHDKPEPQASLSFYVPESVKKATKILAIERSSTLWATAKDAFMIGFDILKQSVEDEKETEDTE
jgi:hypothetical protein